MLVLQTCLLSVFFSCSFYVSFSLFLIFLALSVSVLLESRLRGVEGLGGISMVGRESTEDFFGVFSVFIRDFEAELKSFASAPVASRKVTVIELVWLVRICSSSLKGFLPSVSLYLSFSFSCNAVILYFFAQDRRFWQDGTSRSSEGGRRPFVARPHVREATEPSQARPPSARSSALSKSASPGAAGSGIAPRPPSARIRSGRYH